MAESTQSLTKSPRREKMDYRAELLKSIHEKYGLDGARVMESAFKNEDKAMKEAVNVHGMSSSEIAKGQNIDLGQFGSNQQAAPMVQQSSQQPDMNEQINQLMQQQIQSMQPQQQNPMSSLGNLIKGLIPALGIPEDMAMTRQTDKFNKLKTLSEIQKNMGTENSSKGVYGFDTSSGKVSLQATIPTGSDVRNMQPSTGLDGLPTDLQPTAWALARKIGGVRGAEKVLPSIIKNLQSGKSIDQIEDEIRFKGQSPEFTNSVRDAAQSISVGKSESIKNSDFDALDDYVSKGDMGGAKDYIKRMSVTSAGEEIEKRIIGKERTIEFLDEIKEDMINLEKSGMPTGFISGNIENLMARVGQVKNPEARKLATKIAVAMMNYRKDMTGVAFGQIEGKDYKIMFPNINKVGAFNTASMDGLKEAFGGDIKKFYKQSMGATNYKNLFESDGSLDSTNSTLIRLGLDPNKYELVEE